jgi:hypothetical protein
MKRLVLLLTVVVLVGCAFAVDAQTVVVPAPGATVVAPLGQAPALATGRFSGTAWTWDSQRNIVTLNDAGRIFRVHTTPDQIARLEHHQRVTVSGTLLGPDPIETVLLPTQPMNAVASGPAANVEITGQLGAIEPNGTATVQSARGPLRVWVADNAQGRFQGGQNVKVHVAVQPVRMVAVAGAGGQASGPTLAVPTPPIAGDAATIVGRILGVSATGQLTVESPRGPITVWVPDASTFKMGDFVQVQTVVGPA